MPIDNEGESAMDIKLQCSKCGRWTPHVYPITVRIVLGGQVVASRAPAHLCENCYQTYKGDIEEEGH